MKTFARILDGKVVEIIAPMTDGSDNEIPVEKRFHPDFLKQLVDVSGKEVEQGDLYDGVSFSKPVAATKSLDDLKAEKIDEINREAKKFVDDLIVGYPDFEIQTWPDQKAEALAWYADNTAATPVIDRMAARRKIDRVEYLTRTHAKVIAYQTVYDIVGERQFYVDQVNAIVVDETTTEAQAIELVKAINPVFPIPA